MNEYVRPYLADFAGSFVVIEQGGVVSATGTCVGCGKQVRAEGKAPFCVKKALNHILASRQWSAALGVLHCPMCLQVIEDEDEKEE